MNKLYLKLKPATRCMPRCENVFACIGAIVPAAFVVVLFACMAFVSSASANSSKMAAAPQSSELFTPDLILEQLCLAPDVELSEEALIGFVVAVPDSTTRFRLLRAYPELTFRVFSADEGEIRMPLTEVIASGLVHVWWCNSEHALEHAQDGKPVLQLSRPIVSSVSISSETLNNYFYSNSELIPLRPQELEQLAAVGTLRVGLPEDSSPIISRDSRGNPVGLDNDFVGMIAQRLNLQVAWVDCGRWQECIDGLESRDIDALSFMSPTPSRILFTQFTVPYWEVEWALMSLDHRPVRLNDFQTERDITIAVVESYSIIETVEQASSITVYPVHSPEEGINAVLEGRADAYLDSLPLLMNRVREQSITGAIVHIARGLQGDQVSIGVRSDWASIVPLLDRSIQAITDEDIQEIEERWFDPALFREGLDRDTVQRWAIILSIVALLLLASILAWMAHLRREIEQRKLREAEIRHKAYHDELTGLPNRMHIIEKSQKALITHAQSQRKCALLFIDLDGFKAVNDNEGHDAGDELLIAVAQRLQRAVRKNDTVARYGGDEFLILVTNLSEVKQALTVADKVLQRISMPYRLATGERKIGASIGVAIFPDHGSEYDDLLTAADEAMYAAKQSGKNGIVSAD